MKSVVVCLHKTPRPVRVLCLIVAILVSVRLPGLAQDRPDRPLGDFTTSMSNAMAQMNHGMMAAPSGDPDRDFAAMMIPHHQGAIDMAEVELRFGHDTVLRRLAQAIIVEQGQEIEVMRQVLATLPPVSSGTETPMHPPHPK